MSSALALARSPAIRQSNDRENCDVVANSRILHHTGNCATGRVGRQVPALPGTPRKIQRGSP
jgi:hypothetical protein